MAEVIKCRDLGFDCEVVARAKTVDEALRQLRKHAYEAHHVYEFTPEMARQAEAALLHEEASAPSKRA